MKTRFLFVLLAVWQISNNGLAQEVTQWVYLRSIVSDDKTDSISIYSYSTSRATPFAPNRLLIKSRTDTINEIRVENGTSTKLPDGSFSINWNKPSAGVYNMTFIGHNNYRYHVERINQPFRYFILKNLYDNYKPQAGSPAYTIDDIIHNGKIIGFASSRMDSVLTIKEFQVRVRPLTSSGYLNIISSPIFKGDSIPSGYTESLKKYFSGPDVPSRLQMALQNVRVEGSDSVICKNGYQSSQWWVYEDSARMIFSRNALNLRSTGFIDQHVARSNLRIRIEGYPTPGDIKTIDGVVDEMNSMKLGIKVKKVKFFPSLVIQIDTVDTSLGRTKIKTPFQVEYINQFISQKSGSELLTRVMMREEVSHFFPKLYYSSIFLSPRLANQNERDLFLWQQITRSLADVSGASYNRNDIPIPDRSPGYNRQDIKVLRTIFSAEFSDIIKTYGGSKTPIDSKVMVTVLVCIIFFFIFYEISNYYSLNRIISNVVLRYSVYALLIAQLFVLTGLVIDKNFHNWLFQWEIQLTGFNLVAVWLFFASDKVISKYVRKSWLKLLFNPFLTIICLYLAYQLVYLFIRAEFLRYMTIDINAKFVALSVVVVRFYLQYENEKILSLLQEKNHEVTRQKELKNRAELSALQAKINPHFLYNALNSIAALAHIDSKRTEEMALSLSKLFRYNINREEDTLSTIRQEIEMVQLYLQIEKQRYADRLSFEIIADESLNDKQVPRFLIQPLVENAIKHGISKITGQGIIKLKIYEQDKNLFIEIYDNGPAFPQGLISGYGLQNTYDKLTLVYKKPYEIRFVNEPEKYIQIKL